MPRDLDRRALLTTAPLALGTFLLDPTRAVSAETAAAVAGKPLLHEHYPSQEAEAIKEVVGAAHFSLEKVQALVDERPELAGSAWDWGFGDWETALGAASHTGNYEIAEYLIANGARPDIFTAVMMGNLPAVRALVEAHPGLQSMPGPHGIPMRRHAELGGERAEEVLAYLDEIGGADRGARTEPLLIEQEAYVGGYTFGSDTLDRFDVAVGRFGLTIERSGGTARTLFHQGDHVFHPAGAPSARIRFLVQDGVVTALEIRNPGLIVAARRAS